MKGTQDPFLAIRRCNTRDAAEKSKFAPEQAFQCGACERVVTFPEVLYRDGKCEQCHTTPV